LQSKLLSRCWFHDTDSGESMPHDHCHLPLSNSANAPRRLRKKDIERDE